MSEKFAGSQRECLYGFKVAQTDLDVYSLGFQIKCIEKKTKVWMEISGQGWAGFGVGVKIDEKDEVQ